MGMVVMFLGVFDWSHNILLVLVGVNNIIYEGSGAIQLSSLELFQQVFGIFNESSCTAATSL